MRITSGAILAPVLNQRSPHRWLSLLIVMCGVSLVGLSGSLIKDAIHEETDAFTVLGRALLDGITGDLPAPEPIDKPATTKVLLGVFFILFAQILLVQSRDISVCNPLTCILAPQPNSSWRRRSCRVMTSRRFLQSATRVCSSTLSL